MAEPIRVDKGDNNNVRDPEDYDEEEFADMPNLIDYADSEDDEPCNQQIEDNGNQAVVLNSTLDTDNSLFNDNLVVFDNASGINICSVDKSSIYRWHNKAATLLVAGLMDTAEVSNNASLTHRAQSCAFTYTYIPERKEQQSS
jgi:hypothetical protein